jgi:hypothetical protein
VGVMGDRYKIRERSRRCASPKEGLKQAWDEVQVVEGRKVVARFDLRSQAERWIAEATGAS